MDLTADFSGLFTPPSDDLSFESLMERVQELEERVAMQSIDRLTSVLSTDQFYFEVKRILHEYPEQNFVMWRFDIDKFQTVNNLFGVDEGNRLLKYCAKYLKSNMPTTRSSAIGRMGGDVFCGITPFSDSAMTSGAEGNYWLTSDSTIAGMEPFFKGFRDDFRFSVSIGFYQIEDHSHPIEIMYSRALAATKACKDNSERIYAFYDRNLNASIEEKQLITAEMHSALENGEFTVFLQPKVRLSDLSLVGAEALVRWIHPKKGRIPPDSFIPIFEENGFITKLDLYVLRRCCAYIQSWMRQGMNLIPLSVNLSQMDLSTPGLPFKIMAVLEEYKVAAKYIHLEITESAYADDVEQVNGVTQAFKDLGFHLEMDDFGKGYSSLNMIAELPIDTLKLDMGFLQGDYQGGSGKVISFVTGLARHMDLVTVAEGIETQEQLAYLRSINCDCGQGYLFSRPLAKADFDAYMRGCSIATMGGNKVKHVDKTVAEYKGWQTEEIWDAESKFSKIFNAFGGGIGICEFNVLQGTFRLSRFNVPLVEALHTTHELLKHRCDNLLELIHPEDIVKIRSAISTINDPKDWAKETGTMTMDLRIQILDHPTDEQGNIIPIRYTWVKLCWKLADFSTDTRTYIVQIDDVTKHYEKLSEIEERLSNVDELERQVGIFTSSGSVGMATIRFPHGDSDSMGEVTYANRQFFNIHHKQESFYGITFPISTEFFFSSPPTREKVMALIRGEIGTGKETFDLVVPFENEEGEGWNAKINGKIRHELDGVYLDLVLTPYNEVSTLETELNKFKSHGSLILDSTEITYVDLVEGTVHWGHDLQHAYGIPAVSPLNPEERFPGLSFFHPDSVVVLEQMMKELTEKEASSTVELWMRHENYVDYSLRLATFFSTADEKGTITGISGVGRDITRERYDKSNVTLAEIAAFVPDGILVFALDTGKLLFANDEFYRISGISKEQMELEFHNHPLLLISDEDHRPSVVLPEIAEKLSFVREVQLKNHSMRWIALHGVCRGEYIYATVRDITKRQRLQLQLAREIGFNEILNNIADELLFRVDIHERTVTFSGKSATIFDLPEEPLVFSPDTLEHDIVAEEYVDAYLDMFKDILSGHEKTYTLQMKEKNENISWYRFEYRVIFEAGDPAFAIGKAVNIDYEVGLLAKLERDAMTGCYNPDAMKMRANQILSSSFPPNEDLKPESVTAHALLVIEVKNYSAVSLTGLFHRRDEMIVRVADMICHRFRETDLVGRMTENQFVVFMKNVTIPTMPYQKISDLYQNFHHFNAMSPKELEIDIEISIAFASRDGIHYHTLLEHMNVIPKDQEIV